jgi:hypothetical protein
MHITVWIVKTPHKSFDCISVTYNTIEPGVGASPGPTPLPFKTYSKLNKIFNIFLLRIMAWLVGKTEFVKTFTGGEVRGSNLAASI